MSALVLHPREVQKYVVTDCETEEAKVYRKMNQCARKSLISLFKFQDLGDYVTHPRKTIYSYSTAVVEITCSPRQGRVSVLTFYPYLHQNTHGGENAGADGIP